MTLSTCHLCSGTGMTDTFDRGKEVCCSCGGKGENRYVEDKPRYYSPGCDQCNHTGLIKGPMRSYPCPCCEAPRVDPEGRLIRAAGDVMRAQRLKGIAKYNSTLEDNNSYTVGGMIDMVAEELADGSVYVQKVREQYLALLDELEYAVHQGDYAPGLILNIINRERGNV